MENRSDENREPRGETPRGKRSNNSILIALVIAGLVAMLFFNRGEDRDRITVSFFLQQLEDGNVSKVSFGEQRAIGTFKTRPDKPVRDGETPADDAEPEKFSKDFYFNLSADTGSTAKLQDAVLAQGNVEVDNLEPDQTGQILSLIVFVGLPLAILIFLFVMIRRTRSDIMGGGFLSGFSKSPAKRFEATDKVITFGDVAGLEGVKAEDRKSVV